MHKQWMGLGLALTLGLSVWVGATVPVGAAPPKAKAAVQTGALELGIRNYKKGYIAKAIPYFQQATRQTPGNATAFLWLARAYHKQGKPADLKQAQAAYRQVLNLEPSNREALVALGEMLSWEEARRDEAAGLLKRAFDLNPSDAETAKKLAQTLFWQGNMMDALRYASPIANRFRDDRKFMADYAQMLARTGHPDQALGIYETVLKSEPTLGLKLDQARALLKAGQKQQAQAGYAEIAKAAQGTALGREPGFIQAMAGLAFDLELYADALKWDQQLPPAYQRQKDVQLRTARTLTRVFRVPEAIEYFQRLYDAGLLNVAEKLEYADYLRMLQLEAEALPQPDLIEKLYKEALQEAPGNGEVALRLARYYRDEGNRFDDAVAAYRQALTSRALSEPAMARKEMLDFIKTDKQNPAAVEALFQELLAASPEDIAILTAYAEYLSWQPDRRAEALRRYAELAAKAPDSKPLWEARLEEVLKWHTPSTDLVPVYQEIVDQFPQNKVIWLSVARAYRNDKDYYREAVETYGILVRRYPDDRTIKREWLDLLVSNEGQRDENIRLLEKMVQEAPADLDIRATYGKLLSYQRKYGPAMEAFEAVLSQNPEHRDALVGRGYVILWSGRKYEAKDYFMDLRQRYPDDVNIAIGLASAEKLIGRYDHALRILEEIKPLMQQRPEESGAVAPSADFRLVGDERDGASAWRKRATYDFSILPYEADDAKNPAVTEVSPKADPGAAVPASAGNGTGTVDRKPAPLSAPMDETAFRETAPQAALSAPGRVMMARPPVSGNQAELNAIRSELETLNAAIESLQAVQSSTRRQLDRLDASIQVSREAVPDEISLQAELSTGAVASGGKSVGSGAMTRAYGTYASLDYDTNPLLSGLGRFRNDDMIADMERGLLNDLRPMLRGGYTYMTQDGEETTNALRSYGFPNQVSFSLTPQIRLRGGIQPAKWYIPDGVGPDETWGIEYGLGGTIKYWDRLTLDGDFAVTHFTQSGSENFTFQAQAQYGFNDAIRAKLGFRRVPQYNSLLSIAGLQPGRGAFAGNLVGQARENSVYVELNTHPFSQRVDWNLGYEWAFVDGEKIPTNYKNQAFTSLGYTWFYAANHQARLGYEFLYFGYGKNATNGYFDVTDAGLRDPVAKLRPVTLANSGYDFGGYFSPDWFILNAFRLDLRGSLFNKFLEYKLGGSLGIQDFGLGHGIDRVEDVDASLASSFDANVILNFTDWLAGYGNVDFLDAGGRFNRWRFGGGLILRPHIRALSPLIGGRPAMPADNP